MIEPQIPSVSKQSAPSYFSGIPKIYLLIFLWFACNALTGAWTLFSQWFSLSFNGLPGRFFYPSQYFILPLLNLVIPGVMAWGMYRQAKWMKAASIIWYCLILMFLGYELYPLLNSFGFNSMNEFYTAQGFSAGYVLIFTIPILSVILNTAIFYYLFKKAEFKN